MKGGYFNIFYDGYLQGFFWQIPYQILCIFYFPNHYQIHNINSRFLVLWKISPNFLPNVEWEFNVPNWIGNQPKKLINFFTHYNIVHWWTMCEKYWIHNHLHINGISIKNIQIVVFHEVLLEFIQNNFKAHKS
jgi:hypothetical protein